MKYDAVSVSDHQHLILIEIQRKWNKTIAMYMKGINDKFTSGSKANIL